ncbi:MAG TPA: hypothetical protein PL033_07445 [Candidatus Brocadiia bacterium]|nr:hypothetical protein [Candidatus Brocadiia bacterium]
MESRQRMRRWTEVIQLFLALGSAVAVVAQELPVGVEVWTGLTRRDLPGTFEGGTIVPQGRWCVTHLLLHGLTRDFKGRLEIFPPGERTAIISQPIEVGAGGVKHYQFNFVPRFYSGNYLAKIMDDKGKEVTAVSRVIGWEDCVQIGVVGPLCGLNFFAQSEEQKAASGSPAYQNLKTRTYVYNIDREDMPVQPHGLHPLSVLFLLEPDPAPVQGPRGEALKLWVRNGGVLVASGGASAQFWRGTAVEEMLPLEKIGTATVRELPKLSNLAGLDLPSGRDYVVNTGELRENAEVMVAEELQSGDGPSTAPVLTWRPYGLGKVLFLGFAPVQITGGLRGSRELKQFWRAILPEHWLPHLAENPSPELSATLLGEILIPQEATPISRSWVLLFFTVYFIIVIPVDYALMRRNRQTSRSIVLTLSAVAFFSFLATAISVVAKGTQIVCREITLIEADSRDLTLRGTGYLAGFVPSEGRHTISATAPLVMLSPTERGAKECAFGGDNASLEFRSRTWDMQYFRTGWCLPQSPLPGATEQENLEILIEKLGGSLQDSFVIYRNTVHSIGELKGPPIRTPLVNSATRTTPLKPWWESHYGRVRNLAGYGHVRFTRQNKKPGTGELWPLLYANTGWFPRDEFNYEQFIFDEFSIPASSLRLDTAILIGRCSGTPLEWKIDGSKARTDTCAVARIRVSPELAFGRK